MCAGHRIAIVDDDNAIRKALCRLLRSVGLTVEVYSSGSEFLDALHTTMPDCLVLDLRMPGMSGLELQLELTNRGIQLPIVIITGHAEPDMLVDCMAAGASSYLQKPFDDKTLLNAIDQAIVEIRPRGGSGR